MSETGMVYLVGAGPGDPGLLTLRGRDCLQRADLVLYDGLVNPLLLRHARGRIERTARRQASPCDGRVSQQEVCERMIAAARAGQCVVRLKGGDPYIFGRGGEEAAALAAAGVPFEVVPGITAATAAAVYAGVSLTHRDDASAVAFLTGHEDPHKPSGAIDYALLARFPGTLVFYMALNRLEGIVGELLAHGLQPHTPAVAVSRATLPRQATVATTLEKLLPDVRRAALKPPAVLMIGPAVGRQSALEWCSRRPLRGASIGVPRAEEQADAVIAAILEQGGEPVPAPLIEILPPEDWGDVDRALDRIDEFDWLVFTSVNGVEGLLGRQWERGGDLRSLGRVKLAAIGPATAAALEHWRLRADLTPDEFRAEALAEALGPHVAGSRVLWARADRGRDVLPRALAGRGARLEQVVVYRNVDAPALPASASERIAQGELDWMALSSPSIARNWARLTSHGALSREVLDAVRIAAISPVTAEAAREAGLRVDVVAREFTWAGLLKAIAAASQQPESQLPGS